MLRMRFYCLLVALISTNLCIAMEYDDINKTLERLYDTARNLKNLNTHDQFELFNETFELFKMIKHDPEIELIKQEHLAHLAFRAATIAFLDNSEIDRSIPLYSFVVHSDAPTDIRSAAALSLANIYLRKKKFIAAEFYNAIAQKNWPQEESKGFLFLSKARVQFAKNNLASAQSHYELCMQNTDEPDIVESALEELSVLKKMKQNDNKNCKCIIL
ncbi:MAG: hypothetical protein ACOYT8_01840 [Candidatus Dependentiae bacterium]